MRTESGHSIWINGTGIAIDGQEISPAVIFDRPEIPYENDAQMEKMKSLKKQLRRSGHFVSAAVTAAAAALNESGLEMEHTEKAALLLTSTFGDQDATVDFIDETQLYGCEQGSPIKFAHSSLNMGASYAARLLGVKGPSMTMINFDDCFYNALVTAYSLLSTGYCKNLLLIHCESDTALAKILYKWQKTGKAEIEKPFTINDGTSSAVAFVLGTGKSSPLGVSLSFRKVNEPPGSDKEFQAGHSDARLHPALTLAWTVMEKTCCKESFSLTASAGLNSRHSIQFEIE